MLTSEIGMTESEPGTRSETPVSVGSATRVDARGLSISSCSGHGVGRACFWGAQKKVNSGPATGVKP